MQLNDAVRKLSYTEQAERNLTTPRCKKGNTFPDEGWHNGDDELVYCGLVQEGPDDPASAHHPDAFASLRAESFGKGTDRLGDEVNARGHGTRRRPPGEHIVHDISTEARTHLQASVEGLAAEDLGIGGALEFRESVEVLWSWPLRQPAEIAIGSSHVAVRARRNIDDDFSLWQDTPMSVSSLLSLKSIYTFLPSEESCLRSRPIGMVAGSCCSRGCTPGSIGRGRGRSGRFRGGCVCA